jgi:RNA 3'-phosphate cyclase
MITIDGSYGEGGGQILRYAIALSIITNTPIEIHHIRKNRTPPGLKPQHYTALSLMKTLSNAEVQGLEIGSTKVSFYPHEVPGGVYDVSIGTAGSIPLVFQACLLCGLVSHKPLQITVTGGTDVQWSPSWDYFHQVFISALQTMNIPVKATLHQRGYYPQGGGKATISMNPLRTIQPIDFTHDTIEPNVEGIIHSALLPDHISTRMKHTAIKTLLKHDIQSSIITQNHTTPSPGVGITLWSKTKTHNLGVSMMGKKGIPSEKIGINAAETLCKDVKADATIDSNLFDQLLPYMALASGTSHVRVRHISNHAKTTLWLLQQFLQHDISDVIKEHSLHHVSIHGQHR